MFTWQSELGAGIVQLKIVLMNTRGGLGVRSSEGNTELMVSQRVPMIEVLKMTTR